MNQGVDLARFLESGVAMLGASADESLIPEAFRVWGARIDGDGLLRALVSCDAARTLANLGPGSRLCLTFTDPLTFRSVQVKGRTAGDAEIPGPPDVELMRRYGETFVAVATQRGPSAELVESTRPLAVFAVTVQIDELYDQTPGTGAGRRLGAT